MMEKLHDIDFDKEEPIIVGGSSGSGTRILVYILQAMEVYMGYKPYQLFVHTPHDSIPMAWWLMRWRLPWLLARNEIPAKEMNNGFEAALDVQLAHWDGKSQWGWKNPPNHDMIDYWHKIFPRMKFIHMVRDGRDANDIWFQSTNNEYGPMVPQQMRGNPLQINYMWLWQLHNERTADFGEQKLGSEQYLRVRLEDISADVPTWAERIKEFIGAEKFDAVKCEYIAPPSTIGRHRNFDPELVHHMTEVARPCLERFGYIARREEKNE